MTAKEQLKEKLDKISPYPWFTADVIAGFEAEGKIETMLAYMNDNPDCDDQDILKKDLELDGIFPDENGEYPALEIVDDE